MAIYYGWEWFWWWRTPMSVSFSEPGDSVRPGKTAFACLHFSVLFHCLCPADVSVCALPWPYIYYNYHQWILLALTRILFLPATEFFHGTVLHDKWSSWSCYVGGGGMWTRNLDWRGNPSCLPFGLRFGTHCDCALVNIYRTLNCYLITGSGSACRLDHCYPPLSPVSPSKPGLANTHYPAQAGENGSIWRDSALLHSNLPYYNMY